MPSEDSLKNPKSTLPAGLLASSAPGLSVGADQVSKQVLGNGMTVLVKELHTAPVVAVNAWVRVGSVQETEAEKGITHFIEHMLFKGTQKLKVGELDKLVKAAGGYNNAHTRYESTDFIDVLPASKFDVALETMSDALRHSTFDAEELAREKKVVLEELHRGQDNPGWEAWNRLTHLAFTRSPYRDPIIGYQPVVEKQDRDLLVSYWRRYYTPENMVFVVVGDVNAQEVQAKVAAALGAWKAAPLALAATPQEPAQSALRSEEFSGDIETTVLMLGVPGPSELDDDAPAMEIALGILGQGLSSRLNRRVREEKKLVHEVSAAQFSGKSPGLVYLYAEMEPVQAREAAKALWEEVALMKRELCNAGELAKQHVALEFHEARERMSMDGLASKLGYYECLGGDYRLSDQQLEKMRKVTAEDVRRVMGRYFRPEAANVVLYRPADAPASGLDTEGWAGILAAAEKEAAKLPVPPERAEFRAAVKKAATLPAPAPAQSDSGEFSRFTLKNGINLLVKPVHHTPLVSAFFSFKAGSRLEPADKAGAFNLISRLALKGTATRNAEQVADELDAMGAILSPYSDHDLFSFSAQALSSKFAGLMELAADVIQRPAFEKSEFEKERARTLKDIKDKKDDADNYVDDLFRKALFARSPYGRPLEGDVSTVAALRPEDLNGLQKRFLVPGNLLLSIVGDIEPQAARDLAEKYFGPAAWPAAGGLSLPPVPTEARPLERRLVVETLKKKQAHVMLGWLGARPSDADYFPFRMFNSILGEGMNSRLFTEVRDKEGLCYTVYSTFDRSLDPGAFYIYVGTQPENEQKAMALSLEVVRGMLRDGVSPEELEDAKAYAKGIFEMARQDFSTEARLAAQYELWGMGMETLGRFPALVDAVTLDQVRAAGRAYCDPDKPVIAILRPE